MSECVGYCMCLVARAGYCTSGPRWSTVDEDHDAGTEVAALPLERRELCRIHSRLDQHTSPDHKTWLLVPISLVSTLKSLLPPRASLETTPGPDSTSTPTVTHSHPLPSLTMSRQRGLEIHWSVFALEQIQGLFPRSRNRYCRLCRIPRLRSCLP